MSIGKRIKKLREEKNISMRKLANKSGLTTGHLSHIENDKVKNPSVEMLFNLASELNTTISYLYHGDRDINFEILGDLPQSMKDFIKENKDRYNIKDEDILDLLGFQYRGKQPQTSEGWDYIYNSMRLIITKGL